MCVRSDVINALLTTVNMKKTAAESHRIFLEVYGEHALAE